MEYPKIKPIRLKGKDYTRFRQEVGRAANWTCKTCKAHAPAKVLGVFNLFYCGHVSHIRHHSIGGGDIMSNVIWECKRCHDKRNSPRWSKGER